MRMLTAAACLFGLVSTGDALAQSCAPQPMPSPLDSMGEAPAAANIISFGATPWEYPGRSWAIRLSRRGLGRGALEIMRLKRQMDCNRYDIESRWRTEISKAEYDAVAREVSAVGIPPSDAFANDDPLRGLDGLVLDGTGIELRLTATGWQTRRTMNHYGKGGADISAIFRKLVVKHVPAAEHPAEDWRSRSLASR
jgi:hypothetical protein